MKLKQITAFVVMAATIVSPLNFVNKKSEKIPKNSDLTQRFSFERAVSLNADCSNFESLNTQSVCWPSPMGSVIRLTISGDRLVFEGNTCKYIGLFVYDMSTFNIVTYVTDVNSAELNLGGLLKPNTDYMVAIDYTADDIKQTREEIYISLNDDNEIVFLKSPVYDYNVAKCEELQSSPESLKDYLLPQMDVECDNAEVIKLAEAITDGCNTDWEKAYALYYYVTDEFAYDMVHLNDVENLYHDDVLSLLRRKIAVCEGLANVYVALCRAAGVPSCVSYGYATDYYELSTIDIDKLSYSNHAWAMVCLEGEWYSADMTWDTESTFDGDSIETGEITYRNPSCDWYLVPLEFFSMNHIIYDADTYHTFELSGSCGDNATYELTRDGVLTIYGSGELMLPTEVEGFRKIVFAEDSNITSIGERCFANFDLYENIILPDTVTRIEDYAFAWCGDLMYVYLPDSVKYIGEGAFISCSKLKSVSVPNAIGKIGNWAFDDCSHLILSIPSGAMLNLKYYYNEPLEIIVR